MVTARSLLVLVVVALIGSSCGEPAGDSGDTPGSSLAVSPAASNQNTTTAGGEVTSSAAPTTGETVPTTAHTVPDDPTLEEVWAVATDAKDLGGLDVDALRSDALEFCAHLAERPVLDDGYFDYLYEILDEREIASDLGDYDRLFYGVLVSEVGPQLLCPDEYAAVEAPEIEPSAPEPGTPGYVNPRVEALWAELAVPNGAPPFDDAGVYPWDIYLAAEEMCVYLEPEMTSDDFKLSVIAGSMQMLPRWPDDAANYAIELVAVVAAELACPEYAEMINGHLSETG